ncbi:MAG: alpha/beta hydrolase, partial [Cyanothece sp. SIO1E1]|nr:alpha/beta hydrolase [Cyanothece sp. SIO1E1]
MAYENVSLDTTHTDLEKTTRNQLHGFMHGWRQWVQRLLKSKNISGLLIQRLAVYLGKSSQANRTKLRQLLRKRLELKPIELRHFFHTPIGATLLHTISSFIHSGSDRDGRSVLQEVLLQTAADPKGLSVLNLLHKFPTDIEFNTDRMASAAKQVELLLKATKGMVNTISQLAAAEAITAPMIDFSALPDIRCPGEFKVEQQIITLKDPKRGLRQLQVVLYRPQPWRPGKVPVVIISHGLGARPHSFADYAQHLASYGYVVAIPQHPGSDFGQIQ